jgi:DNA-binding CsgD family transcriptional regulator
VLGLFEELKFFESDHWDEETEKSLMLKIRDLLSAVRHCGKTFEVNINLEVTDLQEAVFLIKKKANKRCEINHQKLSLREIEVLGLIMQGLTNNEIAEKLFVSYETVKSHRKHILTKTGAKNTAALITHYHQTFFEK